MSYNQTGLRHITAYPKVSNRERQRLAQAAIKRQADTEHLLYLLLAQAGGEVTVSKGTLATIAEATAYSVSTEPVVNADKQPTGELLVKLHLGVD